MALHVYRWHLPQVCIGLGIVYVDGVVNIECVASIRSTLLRIKIVSLDRLVYWQPV